MSYQNNLTALRWFAASMVLYGHSFVFLGLPEPTFLNWAPMGPLGVYIFFSISGYLIAQSWDDDPNILRFTWRRVLRIFPGLFVCTLVSIFLIGPLFTSLSLRDYFFNAYTWSYLTNLFLYITFYLPGVFQENLVANAVNGSLWSLPAEFSMYLLVAFLGFFRVSRGGWIFVAIAFMLLSFLWASRSPDMLVFYRTDLRQVVMCGVYFWVGGAFFKYRVDRYFSLTNVFCAAVIWISLTRWLDFFVVGSWLILPFLILAFGLSSGSWLGRFSKLDYSYGIYIYAFPIQQALVSFYPKMPVFWYIIISLVLTIFCAAISWHWVEQPALRLKPRSVRSAGK